MSSDDDTEADSSHEGEEEKKEASPPAGGGKKRKASPTREAEGSKKGRTLPPDCSANAGDDDEDWPQGPSPWRDRKYLDSQITSWFFFSPHNVFLMPHTTLQSA